MSDKSNRSATPNSRRRAPRGSSLFGAREAAAAGAAAARAEKEGARAAPACRASARSSPSCWSACSSAWPAFVAVLVAERKAGPLTEDKVVLITREDDDGPIADQLEKAGVIDNATLFYAMTVLDGSHSALEARRIRVQGRRQHARGRGHARPSPGRPHKLSDPRRPHQRSDRAAPARRRPAGRRHQGDAARGLALSRHLCVRARRLRGRRC